MSHNIKKALTLHAKETKKHFKSIKKVHDNPITSALKGKGLKTSRKSKRAKKDYFLR